MITSIKINETDYPGFKTTSANSNELAGLLRVNIFIGKNNSGKSRFLRSLFKNQLSIKDTAIDTSAIENLVSTFSFLVRQRLPSIGISEACDTIHHLLEEIKEVGHSNSIKELKGIQDVLRELAIKKTGIANDGTGNNISEIYKQINPIANDYLQKFHSTVSLSESTSLVYERSKSYIPILRGLRAVQMITTGTSKSLMDNRQNNYLTRTILDYGIDETEQLSIHTGLDLYEKVTELLLGDHDDRLKIKEFEDFLSLTFFGKDPVHIVPRSGKDVIYIKIGEEKQYPIYDLGEGIQSIILLTFPLFFNAGDNRIFFFEEPETHLHPGLERIFIETLLDKRFSTFQYFITSHSNHILDMTLDYNNISVYSFEKKIINSNPLFTVSNVNSQRKHLLEMLGVRNSSLFLSNCTIWVEGITDRLYLRKYIDCVQKRDGTNYKEDFHYSFIEYAGNNITHWSFLDSEDENFTNINIEGICSKIFLITDSDGVDLPSKRNRQKKTDRLNQLKEKLGENLSITPGREIENLLTHKTIRSTIEDWEGKNQSSLDFKNFLAKSFKEAYLGDFIEKNVLHLKYKYASDYGTIRDKLQFCKTAVSFIDNESDMSPEAIELANKICNFIRASNS